MPIDKNFILKRAHKKPILIDTFYSENKSKQPIIFFCHGYKGFKDWGAWNLMAETMVKAGFCFVKFNFSHNGGTVEDPIDFPDLEAFGNNNYTKELDDVDDIINWVLQKFNNHPNVDTTKIIVLGHSRGGGIAILKAAEDDRITTLITLASVSDFGSRFGSKQDTERWKADGVRYVQNGRTKQQMPHYYQFYEDFKANENRLHIASAERRLQIPHLIIHGDNDTSVKIEEAYALHLWNPKSQLQIIKGADHVLNVRHPWHSLDMPLEFKAVINVMLLFLKNHVE